MKINKEDLKGGMTAYLYLHSLIMDGSGRGEIGITTDINHALKHTSLTKIFKIELEEIPLEYFEEEEKIVKRVLKPKQR